MRKYFIYCCIFIFPTFSLADTDQKYDYIIITTKTIVEESQKLDEFIQHKESLGFHVLVVTEDDFDQLTGSYPNERPDKIRQWLINNYEQMGIEYVLLIGNPTPNGTTPYSIPMKMFSDRFYIGLSLFIVWPEVKSPSDYYYADLDSNWNIIAKNYCGDFFDYQFSDINMEPEVFVGRIPLYDYNNEGELDIILQKIINYENEEDTSWRSSALCAFCFLDTDYDSAKLSEKIVNNILIPANFSYWRMYQQGSYLPKFDSKYDSEEELRNGTVIRRWHNDSYGIVVLNGHGSAKSMSIGDWNIFTEYDGKLLTYEQVETLDNKHPSFVFLDSCNTGEPEGPNLGYGLLKKGGISVICASRGIWFEPYDDFNNIDEIRSSSGLFYRVINKSMEYPIGKALGLSKFEINDILIKYKIHDYRYFMNLLRVNLYGDPSIHL